MKRYDFFSSFIFRDKINPLEYNKSDIVNSCIENYKIDKNRNNWDGESVLHHAYDDFENDKFLKLDLTEVRKIYYKILYSFFKENFYQLSNIQVNSKIVNVSVNTKFMNWHHHFGYSNNEHDMFSFVHYIKFEKENHGKINFKNPLMFSEYTRPSSILMCEMGPKNMDVFQSSIEVDVEEDDLIIFPSYFEHMVFQKNEIVESSPRIMIAGNVGIKRVDKL